MEVYPLVPVYPRSVPVFGGPVPVFLAGTDGGQGQMWYSQAPGQSVHTAPQRCRRGGACDAAEANMRIS